MTGITKRGMKIMVYLDSEEPDFVMIGICKSTARTYSAYPITVKEARNLANWLNSAADEAEKTPPRMSETEKPQRCDCGHCETIHCGKNYWCLVIGCACMKHKPVFSAPGDARACDA